jgi:hypothetical protein
MKKMNHLVTAAVLTAAVAGGAGCQETPPPHNAQPSASASLAPTVAVPSSCQNRLQTPIFFAKTPSPDGRVQARNTECTYIVDPLDLMRTIGTLAAKQDFTILCGPNSHPASLDIEYGNNQVGQVVLDDTAFKGLEAGKFPPIRQCMSPGTPTPAPSHS